MVNSLLTMSIKVNVLCICRIAVRSTGDENEEADTGEGLLELGHGLRLEQRGLERLSRAAVSRRPFFDLFSGTWQSARETSGAFLRLRCAK
jgi:hypothetical protein